MPLLSALYAALARGRRRWYAASPGRRRRLDRPVVSVGALAAGGSGKTPVAAIVARLLAQAGHRPSILTRGYARAAAPKGVTVVSDGARVLAGLDLAGDEPLMLARQLPGVPVLVSRDRYEAGRVAETRLGCTIHVLDDGFQHFALERDIDLVLLSPEDLANPVTLPAGRLREPLDLVRAASGVVVGEADRDRARAIGRAFGIDEAFSLVGALDGARLLGVPGARLAPGAGTRVLAVAGIARPERFFASLEAAGWTVAGRMPFRDHHRFTRRDLARIADAARRAGAGLVLTTEKDAVRMEPLGPPPVRTAWVPLIATVEPAERFGAWLLQRLESGRRPPE